MKAYYKRKETHHLAIAKTYKAMGNDAKAAHHTKEAANYQAMMKNVE